MSRMSLHMIAVLAAVAKATIVDEWDLERLVKSVGSQARNCSIPVEHEARPANSISYSGRIPVDVQQPYMLRRARQ